MKERLFPTCSQSFRLVYTTVRLTTPTRAVVTIRRSINFVMTDFVNPLMPIVVIWVQCKASCVKPSFVIFDIRAL